MRIEAISSRPESGSIVQPVRGRDRFLQNAPESTDMLIAPRLSVDGGSVDNCTNAYNPDQADNDLDGLGDACDSCPTDPANDVDADGVCGEVDNCPTTANPLSFFRR